MQDVCNILKSDCNIEKVLSIVLDIHKLMMSNTNEAYYLVNEFFTKRAIVWLQKDADGKVLKAIGEDLSHVTVSLDDLGLNQYFNHQSTSFDSNNNNGSNENGSISRNDDDIDSWAQNEDDPIDEIGTSLCQVTICCDPGDDSDA